MNNVAKLAGFIGAHAIWCVSDRGPLVPMVGFQRADGSKGLLRFATSALEAGVAQARAWLEVNSEGASEGVAALDGYYPLPFGKSDAILLEGFEYGSPRRRFSMAIPYRPASEGGPFSVFRPKFILVEADAPDYGALADSFFAGVDSHEEGAKVWAKYMDQSQ